ncbi:MAG: chemotaxis protein CheW, partial [Opitutales bacterium]
VTPTEDGVVALLADAVGDVIDVEESTFEAPPKSLSPEACALVPGVFKLSGRLLHLLDVERAADLST